MVRPSDPFNVAILTRGTITSPMSHLSNLAIVHCQQVTVLAQDKARFDIYHPALTSCFQQKLSSRNTRDTSTSAAGVQRQPQYTEKVRRSTKQLLLAARLFRILTLHEVGLNFCPPAFHVPVREKIDMLKGISAS